MSYQNYDEWFHQNINNQLGEIQYEWNETGVDLMLSDSNDNEEVAVQQTIDFFTSIDAPNLKEGSIRKIFEEHSYSSAPEAITDMLYCDKIAWVNVIGKNGEKIYDGLQTKLSDMPLYTLMGSVPFFGRGVGKRRFRKLEQVLGPQKLFNINNINDIIAIPGFEEKTARKIVDGMEEFHKFYNKIKDKVNINFEDDKNSNLSLQGINFVFTGFRDKISQAKIEGAGGEVKSSVSKKTNYVVTKNPNTTSGKIKKARELGIQVLSPEEFEELLTNLLS
jgi:NAD-dependent DNA ligase